MSTTQSKPAAQSRRETVVRTMRYPIYTDTAVHLALVGAADATRRTPQDARRRARSAHRLTTQ